MGSREFSAAYMRNPVKAAADLRRRRARIAELHAGARPHAHESLEEHQRVADRLLQAFRDTGRCEDCGKALTDPESLERGIGPECLVRRAASVDDDESF